MSKGNGIYVIGRASPTGLGYMTKDFCAAMVPERVIPIDTSNQLPFYPDWFSLKWSFSARDWDDYATIRSALRSARLVVGFETFYSAKVLEVAREMGIKTIMFPMWECSPKYAGYCDVRLCLSDQDAQQYPGGVRCHWPASDEAVRAVKRNWPPVNFVHNAGHANHNRNSTREVLAAANWLKGTGARLLVRSQFQIPRQWLPVLDQQGLVVFDRAADQRHDLYRSADCIVHPMQFAGLSLPMVEAAANRIPTIVSDLPEWSGWPYRVKYQPSNNCRFARNVKMQPADVRSLGELMRDMATGAIALDLPPQPPSWSEFKSFWNRMESIGWSRN